LSKAATQASQSVAVAKKIAKAGSSSQQLVHCAKVLKSLTYASFYFVSLLVGFAQMPTS
jgi:hypothetical protein